MSKTDSLQLPEAPTLGERHLRFWQARLDDEHYVYVLRAGKRNPIKIGVAKNPKRRVATLQTGNAATLRLLLVLPGGERLEKALHERFKAARMANGEWFGGRSLGPILRFVNSLSREMVKSYEATGEVPDFERLRLWHGGDPPRKLGGVIVPPIPPQNRSPWGETSYVQPVHSRIAGQRIKAKERGLRGPCTQ